MAVAVGPWHLEDIGWKWKRRCNQGLTTVATPEGSRRLVFRGDHSIAADLREQGWMHIGDPDSWEGSIIDPYQHADGELSTSKLFRVTGPDGRAADFEHQRHAGVAEAYNNSFVAVAPGGDWMVSGEWGTRDRFLVFPTPGVNPLAGRPGDGLPLMTLLELEPPVRKVQGAVFLDHTTILCSTDDDSTDADSGSWPVPRQLLEVTLPRPLDGSPMRAPVRCLGRLPCPQFGQWSGEVEGIDYDQDSRGLRVVIVPLRRRGGPLPASSVSGSRPEPRHVRPGGAPAGNHGAALASGALGPGGWTMRCPTTHAH